MAGVHVGDFLVFRLTTLWTNDGGTLAGIGDLLVFGLASLSMNDAEFLTVVQSMSM